MTHMTPEETALLRKALGLHANNRENPTRNRLFTSDAESHPVALASLIKRQFLVEAFTFGPGGKEIYYKATDAGRFGVLEQPWKT